MPKAKMLKVTHIRDGKTFVSAVDVRDLSRFERENTILMVESFS
jgi:hypothetical protein